MKVYAWLIDLIHRRKNCPRGWFPGGSKKWPNTAGQYGISCEVQKRIKVGHFFLPFEHFIDVRKGDLQAGICLVDLQFLRPGEIGRDAGGTCRMRGTSVGGLQHSEASIGLQEEVGSVDAGVLIVQDGVTDLWVTTIGRGLLNIVQARTGVDFDVGYAWHGHKYPRKRSKKIGCSHVSAVFRGITRRRNLLAGKEKIDPIIQCLPRESLSGRRLPWWASKLFSSAFLLSSVYYRAMNILFLDRMSGWKPYGMNVFYQSFLIQQWSLHSQIPISWTHSKSSIHSNTCS